MTYNGEDVAELVADLAPGYEVCAKRQAYLHGAYVGLYREVGDAVWELAEGLAGDCHDHEYIFLRPKAGK